jgi:hypothetical protein
MTNGTDVQVGTISDELGEVVRGSGIEGRLVKFGGFVELEQVFEHSKESLDKPSN